MKKVKTPFLKETQSNTLPKKRELSPAVLVMFKRFNNAILKLKENK